MDSRIHESVVLAYHGCDLSVAEKLVSGSLDFRSSENPYDWLGDGVYFFEGDAHQAHEFATLAAIDFLDSGNTVVTKGKISCPAVIGVVLSLAQCLDLTRREHIQLLSSHYKDMSLIWKAEGKVPPENKKTTLEADWTHHGFAAVRCLDRELINTMCISLQSARPPADIQVVRAAFDSGAPAFDGSHLSSGTHIQLAVRNMRAICGVFWPRSLVGGINARTYFQTRFEVRKLQRSSKN
jgi:hypothetical protein